MASTENLLQYSDITTNTLESGYHSDSHELDNGSWQKRANKKKNYQRGLGLENEGFEPDREHVDRGAKHRVQVHRALSEKASTVPEAKTNTVQRKDKRRHSYAEGTTVDRANITDGVIQRVRTPRRRTSSTEIDLRRRACLNSMRLRQFQVRVSSLFQKSTIVLTMMSFISMISGKRLAEIHPEKHLPTMAMGETKPERNVRKLLWIEFAVLWN